MEKAKNVFAVLGLVWVIDIVVHLIFPRAMWTFYVYCSNVSYHLSAALHGSRESEQWIVVCALMPAFLILLVVFAGIGVQSVIARVIRKARA